MIGGDAAGRGRCGSSRRRRSRGRRRRHAVLDVAVERARPAHLRPVRDAVAVARRAHPGARRLDHGVGVEAGVGEQVEARVALVGGERGLVGAFGRALDVADQPPAAAALAVRVGDHEHRTGLRDLAAEAGGVAGERRRSRARRCRRRARPTPARSTRPSPSPDTTSGALASCAARTIDGASRTGNTLTGGGLVRVGRQRERDLVVLREVQVRTEALAEPDRGAPRPSATDGLVRSSQSGTAPHEVEAVGLRGRRGRRRRRRS